MLRKDIDINLTGYDVDSPVQLRVIGTREGLTELASAILACLESPKGEVTELTTGAKGDLGFLAVYMKKGVNKEPQKSFSERLFDEQKVKNETNETPQ